MDRLTAEPDPAGNEKDGLQRLAGLTRRVMAVPKDEVSPIFKPKKPAKRKRRH